MKALNFSVAVVVASSFFSTVVIADVTTSNVQVVSVPKVTLSEIAIETVDEALLLTGEIKRTLYNTQVLPGHIDYVVLGADGSVIDKGAVQYSPSLSLRRWKYGSSFSVVLPAALPQDSIIKIGYHRDSHAQSPGSAPASHTEHSLL